MVGQIRVFELAGELGIAVSRVMDKICELGWPEVSSDAALLEPERADHLRAISRQEWDLPLGRWSAARAAAEERRRPERSRVVVQSWWGGPRPCRLHPDGPPLTAAEAAPLLDAAPTAIRQWVARGYLSSVGKRGRAHLYEAADLVRVRHEVDGRKPQVPYPGDDPLLQRRLEELLTTPQAAELARVAPSTIRMWVTRGRLAPISGSRPHRYTVAAVRRAARRSLDPKMKSRYSDD